MVTREVAGRAVAVTNLDKVLYPATGTTKGQIIDYYAEIADALLPHVADRPVTRKRWPNGVGNPSFFEKNLPTSTPDWIDRRRIAHTGRDVIYPLLRSPADLVWTAQQAALELHVPQWRFPAGQDPDRDDSRGPCTRLVFDLDPGEGVDLDACAVIARAVREMVTDIGLTAYPLTSGSKGIHIYVPLATPVGAAGATTVAKEVATLLEKRFPDTVTATMSRAARPGKIFLDWSQNNGNKTTVAPYSLRGREHPTVAAPRTWEEIEGGSLEHLTFTQVLERFRRDGDLLAGLDPAVDTALPPDPLGVYRGKRSATRTPEPMPMGPPDTTRPGPPIFVIQEHRARRLHYDVRLEHAGVLASWAVPKNLPDTSSENRLAVRTEDHPLEYAEFEGTIPAGEYGAGEMSIHDRGTYEAEKWRDDEVIVTLHGERVTGRYAFVRTGGDQWLVRRTAHQETPKSPVPIGVRPMLATTAAATALGSVLGDGDWVFEGKWDGIRLLLTRTGGRTTLASRTGGDLTGRFPTITALGDELGEHEVILDGEAVVPTDTGDAGFAALGDAPPSQVRLFAFDVLHLDGVDLTGRKYRDRRRILELLGAATPSLIVPPTVDGPIDAAVAESQRLGWEGLVAKRTDSTYEVGRRSTSWIKLKNWRTQDVVIGGWRRGKGARASTMGSLLVGVYESGALRYAGRVGTGFTDSELDRLATRLAPMVTETCPFGDTVPAVDRRDAVWVEPTLVGSVRFYEWTSGGVLRHPSWLGLGGNQRGEN